VRKEKLSPILKAFFLYLHTYFKKIIYMRFYGFSGFVFFGLSLYTSGSQTFSARGTLPAILKIWRHTRVKIYI